MPQRLSNARAGVRVALAALLGVVAGFLASTSTLWQAAMLIGWDAGAICLLLWIWSAVAKLNAEDSKTHASKEDTSVRLSETNCPLFGSRVAGGRGTSSDQGRTFIGRVQVVPNCAGNPERGADVGVGPHGFHVALCPHLLLQASRRD